MLLVQVLKNPKDCYMKGFDQFLVRNAARRHPRYVYSAAFKHVWPSQVENVHVHYNLCIDSLDWKSSVHDTVRCLSYDPAWTEPGTHSIYFRHGKILVGCFLNADFQCSIIHGRQFSVSKLLVGSLSHSTKTRLRCRGCL